MTGNVSYWVHETAGSTLEYFVNASKLNDYETAKRSCLNMGGMLVSILSNVTQIFLEQIVPSQPTTSQARHYWIGATKITYNSSWLWQDDKILNYTLWDTSQEVNQTGELCSTVWVPQNHKWTSQNCVNDDFGYVCQREKNAATLDTTTAAIKDITAVLSQTTVNTTMSKMSIPWTTAESLVSTTPRLQPYTESPVYKIVVPIIVVVLLAGIILGVYLSKKRKETWSKTQTGDPQPYSTWNPLSAITQQSQPPKDSNHANVANSKEVQNKLPDEPAPVKVTTVVSNVTYENVVPGGNKSSYGEETNKKDSNYVDIYSVSSKRKTPAD